jgi:MFS family permease
MASLIRRLTALLPDLAPLRESPPYRRLLLGQGVSYLGSMITAVAFPYQIWQLTHSTVMVGLIGLVELIPLVALALVGGALADAMDRRRLLLLAESGLAICTLTLTLLAWHGNPPLWSLYALAAITSGLTGLHRPALEAIVPRLVRKELMPAVASLRGAVGTSCMIGGPALGGWLLVTFGLTATFAIDFLSFVIALGTIVSLPSITPERAEAVSFRRIVEGLRYARSRPDLMGTYLVDIVAMFFAMPNALFPALAEELGGARILGFLYAAPAAGALLVSLTSGWAPRVYRQGRAIALAAAAWGIAIAGAGLATQWQLVVLMLAVAGGADAISAIFRSTIWNQTIPDHLRGRLGGIEQISYMTGPHLGNVEAGFAAAVAGVRGSIVWGGVLCVAGTAAVAASLGAFWQYDARRADEIRESAALAA